MRSKTAAPISFPTRPIGPPVGLRFATPPLGPTGGQWSPVYWVGCHGGAGVKTLAALTGLGTATEHAWPLLPAGWPANVVLVCRATASGTWAASCVVEQYARRMVPPQTRVLGLVAVAGSPRRPPRVVADRLKLIAGWVPQVWQVSWVEALIAADNPRDIGLPPDVVALRHHLGRALEATAE